MIEVEKNQNLFGEIHDDLMNEKHRTHNKGSREKGLLNL